MEAVAEIQAPAPSFLKPVLHAEQPALSYDVHLSQLGIQLYVQAKLVVTRRSLTAPPASPGQAEQVTLAPTVAHAAQPVGHGFNATVVLTVSL